MLECPPNRRAELAAGPRRPAQRQGSARARAAARSSSTARCSISSSHRTGWLRKCDAADRWVTAMLAASSEVVVFAAMPGRVFFTGRPVRSAREALFFVPFAPAQGRQFASGCPEPGSSPPELGRSRPRAPSPSGRAAAKPQARSHRVSEPVSCGIAPVAFLAPFRPGVKG